MVNIYEIFGIDITSKQSDIQRIIQLAEQENKIDKAFITAAKRWLLNEDVRDKYNHKLQESFPDLFIGKPSTKTNNFVVIDVETANPNVSSICQIGIAVFDGSKVVDTWESLINPMTYFDDMNISIHGIEEHDVKDKPTIKDVRGILEGYLYNNIVVSHGHFDKPAIYKALNDFKDTVWLNNMSIVRRTWQHCSQKGYGLADITDYLGIEMIEHHDALSDAIAAGLVTCEALKETKTVINDWLELIKKPLSQAALLSKRKPSDRPAPNINGILYGEVVVVTGELSKTRVEIENIALENGATIRDAVTSKTTILVRGEQDAVKIKGTMSTKERKAKELIKTGQQIIVVSEEDFYKLFEQ